MDRAKLILNPARLRILQHLKLCGRACTAELVEHLAGVPRATVYHHVKLLEQGGLIEVVQENRVRGTVEKVYAMKAGGLPITEGADAAALSTAFHMGLMQEMNDYFGRGEGDCRRDNVFFTSALLCLTDGEYAALLRELVELLKPYAERTEGEGRRLRKLSIIASPPGEAGDEHEFP
ncbi:helix-turn-helix domain-containing protein [Lawsonibacter faecis]|uniref:Helix-turn-helix domain-containing protein n=1 Tax=Lawsonibacter faecis TaxID=2763052 RepID=A0A8J6M7E2_9FIRM|nr:helix-turn-helix domain-containing protein [Lawsonibacter faecis]MBC5736397.1 helix-turn-helix domain-containing protein [Lawsonibacter faecis]